ncbi:MAG: hypothetical protein RL026_1470 [Pseudomonadota bacterium]|jgi:uncharacterized DUF497 family protein
MQFEYDPAKSAANLDKHGIDFVEAQGLWEDPELVVLAAREQSEQRWLALGKARGSLWAAIFTVRAASIRLISVRRARPEEARAYEED